jgi:hypothetical protein
MAKDLMVIDAGNLIGIIKALQNSKEQIDITMNNGKSGSGAIADMSSEGDVIQLSRDGRVDMIIPIRQNASFGSCGRLAN